MLWREYDPARDREASARIWREVGWLTDDDNQLVILDDYLADNRTLVAELEGAAEALVTSTPATIQYLDETLPMAACTGVTTSRVARKQGFARRLTARLLAADAAAGFAFASLGMFDQGFYDQLGYGPGAPQTRVTLDPATLTVPDLTRPPVRLTVTDGPRLYAALVARQRNHGACSLSRPGPFVTECRWHKGSAGLGFETDGELTHFLWFDPGEGENGQWEIKAAAWRTGEQFRELLSLLKSLGDQVDTVTLFEPPAYQLQDWLRQPLRRKRLGRGGRRATGSEVWIDWEGRLLDLSAALAATHLPGEPVRFNLRLSDPVADFLDDGWRGLGGEFKVTLGPESSAVRGSEPAWPTMAATVNAFSRLWLGVRPASGLAMTDRLSAPPRLLADLDRLLRLPPPWPGWRY